jgi:hypothetical protein
MKAERDLRKLPGFLQAKLGKGCGVGLRRMRPSWKGAVGPAGGGEPGNSLHFGGAFRDQSGKILTWIIGFMASYVVVFALTFYFLNGRSFRLPRAVPEQATTPSEQDTLQSSLADSLRLLQVRIAAARAVLDSLITESNRKQVEIRALEEKLSPLLDQERQEELRRARKLAAILAALPDSSITSTVAGMDDDLLVLVLQKSTEKGAARVLAALDAARAARLSQRLVLAE